MSGGQCLFRLFLCTSCIVETEIAAGVMTSALRWQRCPRILARGSDFLKIPHFSRLFEEFSRVLAWFWSSSFLEGKSLMLSWLLALVIVVRRLISLTLNALNDVAAAVFSIRRPLSSTSKP